MGCISGIIRTIMFIFNIACLIVGLALIVLGSLAYSAVDNYNNSLSGSVTAVPIVLLVVGVFIFLVSFLGCCGAIKSNKCMLMTYAIVMIILLVIQLSVGIYGLVQVNGKYEEFKDEVIKGLKNTLEKYENDEPSKVAIDSLQLVFQCCGVNSPSDYKGIIINMQEFPGSCCGNTESTCPLPKYTNGCGDKFFDMIQKYVKIISIVAIVICAIELLGAIFALYLSRKK